MLMGNKNSGFTLIELLTVISIIAVLASVILVVTKSAYQKSRDGRRLADVSEFITAVNLYYNDNGSYPPMAADDTGTCLDLSTSGGFVPGIVAGGYMSKNIKDPGGINNNYWWAKGGTVLCDQTLQFDCPTAGAKAELVLWYEVVPSTPHYEPNGYGARSESVCFY